VCDVSKRGLFIYVFIYLFIYLFAYLFVFISFFPLRYTGYVFIYLFIYLFDYLFIYCGICCLCLLDPTVKFFRTEEFFFGGKNLG
jgi:hypothetical protein